MTKKLCYVLPEYYKSTSEHYYHIYEFLEEVAKQLDVYLVVEKLTGEPDFKNINKVCALKWGIPFNWLERLFIFVYLRFKGYDTFYIHYSYSSAITASLITRLLGGKTLYWHCNLKKDFMVRWQLSWRTIKTKLLDDYPFLLSLRLVNYLVTGANYMKDYYSTNFGLHTGKIKIMPNWVNLKRFSPTRYNGKKVRQEFHLEESDRVVLFVHWLSLRKGPQHLVAIAQRVREEVPNVMFVVVGEGPYRETLEREVEANGLSEIIKLAGAVPNQEIPRYYAIADLFIMPSGEEGFPRVLIEAMAMGVPFVATDVGSVNEITTDVQKEGVVPKGDVGAFSKKVSTVLRDNSLREKLRLEGIRHSSQFSLENSVALFCTNVLPHGVKTLDGEK